MLTDSQRVQDRLAHLRLHLGLQWPQLVLCGVAACGVAFALGGPAVLQPLETLTLKVTIIGFALATVCMTVLSLGRSRETHQHTIAARNLAATRQTRFDRVLDSTMNLVTIVDEHGQITYQNSAITGLLGRYPWDVLGQPFALLASGQDQFQAGWLLATARAHGHAPLTRIRLDTGSGQRRILEATATNCLDDPAVRGIVISGRDVSEQVRLETQHTHLATTDALTGLLNHDAFHTYVESAVLRASRLGFPLGLAVINLDGFRLINEDLGHATGDRTLEVVAHRLRSIAGADGTLARLHGDTFGLLLEHTEPSATTAVMHLAREVMAQEIRISGHHIPVSAGIGYSCLGPDEADVGTGLICEAEAALFNAKRRGSANLVRFSTDMATPSGRIELESDLRHAIEHDEFAVYFQPVVSLEACDVVEMEALVRWRHPSRGLVMPGTFIPMAEQTGLIIPIGWWVLEQACQQGRTWLSNRSGRPLTMSVNLSPRMFHQPDLLERTTAILEATGFPANQLRLEITESVMVDDLSHATAVLTQLKSLGIQLAIDDFGIGFSSLSYLQHFPVDVIKIDRQFIATMADNHQSAEIVRSIVSLAKRLNLETTGEGIETADQLATLRELGSDRGQGFLFSRPLPACDLDLMVMDQTAHVAAA